MENPTSLTEAASMLGRKGGAIGGKRRAANQTPEERSALARKAVMTRWAKHKKGKAADGEAPAPALEIAKILKSHAAWLRGEERGKRADLRGTILHNCDLRGANLSGADLSDVFMFGANLNGADLRGARLHDAELSGADLRDAKLSNTDLSGAGLRVANLGGADLRGADLSGADLRGAYLRGAMLCGADLHGAHLADINLHGALINWKSPDLVAEILRAGAGDEIEKLKIAGLVLITPWRWDRFASRCSGDPLWGWTIDILARHVRDGDDAPDILKARAADSVQVAE